jgi:hypothetical protein
MLALWLPATQHCDLEAAGLIAGESSHAAAGHCSENSGSPCAHDACNIVEGSLIKPNSDTIKVPAPTLAACACYFLCLQRLTPEMSAKPASGVTEPERPQHWVPVWQFVRRAAPLSRAPSPLA